MDSTELFLVSHPLLLDRNDSWSNFEASPWELANNFDSIQRSHQLHVTEWGISKLIEIQNNYRWSPLLWTRVHRYVRIRQISYHFRKNSERYLSQATFFHVKHCKVVFIRLCDFKFPPIKQEKKNFCKITTLSTFRNISETNQKLRVIMM